VRRATFRVVDLFAGAGGSTTATKKAADRYGVSLSLTAINHWWEAVRTHEENHPWARHILASLGGISPREAVPGQLDALIAGPECIHHANARGNRPVNDQSRSTAWLVVDWAEAKRPKWLLIENIKEFLKWGPLYPPDYHVKALRNRPIPERAGELFALWVQALRALGYTLEWRVLNAANFGGATTRERVFIMGRLDGPQTKGALPWPAQTHAPVEAVAAFTGGKLLPWRSAKDDVIDWTRPGRSIFNRPDPLAPATLERIAHGAAKFWGVDLQPFLVVLRKNADARSLGLPLPAITSSGNHFGLIEPFVLGQQSGSVARPTTLPLPTIARGGAISLIEPFLISYYGTKNVSSVRQPLPTVTTRDRFGLIEPKNLDVTLRMLHQSELAAGQGFPADYKWVGNDRDVKAQIGNAWEVNKATALMSSIMREHFGIEEERAA
jgi:DNA (cytosine-5)-methyltransferase 1